MSTLYKRLENGRLAYREAWAAEGTIYDHSGEVGSEGETRELPVRSRDGRAEVAGIVDEARRQGFAEIDLDRQRRLIVEFEVEGMGKAEDVDKLAQLQYDLNEILGWRGLGECEGNSIGSGTMEVCCFVVDFDIAKSAIVEGLKGTSFANYTRIYDEDEA